MRVVVTGAFGWTAASIARSRSVSPNPAGLSCRRCKMITDVEKGGHNGLNLSWYKPGGVVASPDKRAWLPLAGWTQEASLRRTHRRRSIRFAESTLSRQRDLVRKSYRGPTPTCSLGCR